MSGMMTATGLEMEQVGIADELVPAYPISCVGHVRAKPGDGKHFSGWASVVFSL